MAIEAQELIRLNREQVVSEADDFTPERYAQFARHLGKDVESVLDLGCNTGRGGEILREMMPGIHLLGVDVVSDRLAEIPPEIYDETVCGFADKLPLPSGSLDAIVAGELIEHIPGGQVMPVLHEAFRLLRLGGYLLLTTPNPLAWKARMTEFSVLGDASHLSQHTPLALARKLEDAGFLRVKFVGSGRLTRRLGERMAPLNAYGSYLAIAQKW